MEYKRTEVYWHILAARLTFVVVFQNVVALAVMAIKLIIPNVSSDLKERIRREAYLTNEIIIRTELLKAKGKLNLRREYSVANDGDNEDKEDSSLINGSAGGGDGGEAGRGEDERNSWRRRRGGKRHETGDVTDGHIVV